MMVNNLLNPGRMMRTNRYSDFIISARKEASSIELNSEPSKAGGQEQSFSEASGHTTVSCTKFHSVVPFDILIARPYPRSVSYCPQ